MADTNDFDDAAASVMQGQATAIRNNISNAVTQNPATVTQHVKLAGALGVPLESVQADPATAKQQVALQSFDAQKVVSQYPHLAQFLTDPVSAAKAHTDLPTLAATEQAVKSLPQPAPATAAPALDGAGSWLSNNAKSIPDLPLALVQGVGASFNSAAKAVNTVGGMFPSLYDKAASFLTGTPTTDAQDAYAKHFIAPLDANASALNLSPNATTLQKITHGVGGLVGTLAQIAGSGGMSEAPAVADAAAPILTTATNAVAHAARSMAFPAITAAVNTGHDVYQKTGSLAAAVQAATAAYGTNTAMGVLPLSMTGSVLQRAATGFPIGALTGELNRQVMNAGLPGAMQQPAGVEDAIINGLTGSILAGAMGPNTPPHEVALHQAYAEAQKADQATQGMQGLQALGELSAKSELRKNDPQAFTDFVQKVADDGHLPEVWIDGKTLTDALNQSGIPLTELQAKLPDVAAQLHEAMQTKGDVRIKTADYATSIAGGPLEQAILPHLKTDPDGMTFKEGQEHLTGQQAAMTTQAKALTEEQGQRDARTAQLKTITDGVQSQLDATGRFPSDVAKQYAAMHGAFYDNMSERMGISPEEMRARMPLNIRGEGAGGFSQGAKIETPEFKNWFGDSKVVDASGKPLVVYHGRENVNGLTTFDMSERDGYHRKTSGAYFSADKEYAASYPRGEGNPTVEAYISAKKPLETADYGVIANIDAERMKALKAEGYDAVVYHDPEGERFNEVLAFDPEQIKSATGNDGSFDANDPSILSQGNRGFYDPATGRMGLLKDADLSTFLHESGHFFLESMHDLAKSPEAPQGIKDDFDTLLTSFKVYGATPEERAADWAGRTLDEKREGHEQFAEGFENYLLTGKAPVPELQSMFSRFRSWLMNVYTSMRGEVSPEVRGVMDRMFASQEAITEAERVRSYAIPDLPGEHGPLIDEYKTLGKEATEQAIADMQARSMRDLKWASNAKSKALRELQRTAKDERAKITDEVTKEVTAEPINKARTWLTKGEMTDGDGNPVKVEKGFKLNTDDLRSMYPQSTLASIDLADLRGMTAKDGLHPDLVADMFGFNSGKGLVNELIHGETAAAKIKGVTDQRMLERHGDLIDPVSVERAAEAAIHNEVRAKMMATGLKMFTKSPMSVIEINKAAKAAADTAIAIKAVGDLRPAQYSAAEAKANKELLKLAPKDPMGAAQAQRAALLNNRLFKSASEAVADVRAGLVYLKRFTRDSVRGKIDVDVRDQIDDLLARFDLRASPSDKPTRAQLNLEKWIDSQAAAGYSPTVTPEMLAPEFRKPYRELSVEQFRGMVDTIKSMEHMGKERNSLTINGAKVALADYVNNELVPKLQERGDRFSIDEIYSKVEDRGVSPMAVALDHVSSWLRALGAQLKPQEFKRNDFDRHELLGPFGKALFDPVIDANYNKVRMLKGLSDDFRAKAAELGRDWQKSLHDMLPNDQLIDAIATKEAGHPVYMKLSRGKMVGLAIHVGNESNFDKLTKGYGWEPEKVWGFLHENMTAKDWDAVQHVWDLYEKHWPDMQAMYKRLGQTTPDKIEPRAFHTPFGEIAGGYAAIKYDPLRSRRGERDAAGAAIDPGKGLFGADYFSRTATTNGSMNKRMDGYTDAIDLNFHTIERSLQESIHDLAYRESLINANKIVEHPDFRKAFFKAYGREDHEALQTWIGRIANSANSDREVGAMGRFMQYTRTGMVMNAIALRATTVLKHGGSAGIKTLGYFAGGGEQYLASRFAAMGSDYTNQIASAKEKFGEINSRLLQQDRDYRATASSMFEPEGIASQAERFGHAAVAWSDMMTAVPTAWAAYDRAITEGIPVRQGGTGAPMTEAQAVSYANKIVREAHGSNIEAARSNIMTAPSEGLKMLTTLYGFMNNSYGQMADSINKFQTPGIGKPEVVARTLMAIIVPALWAGYLSEGGAKKDESWGAWAAKAITGEVAGMVPVVRDAFSMVQGFRHAGVIGVESWMQTLVQPVLDAGKVATGHPASGAVSHLADAVGMGLHIPGLGQLGKSAQYAADVSSGKQHPANAAEYAAGMIVGAPKK